MSSSLPSIPRLAEFPRRIVCLTDETTETLYLLGEQDRIVGVSGYATRPSEARLKPRVSAFRNAKFDAILNLNPDLVLAFSDVQAEITRELVLRGATVLNFNQRSIAEILEMIAMLSRIVGNPNAGLALIEQLQQGLAEIATSAKAFPRRPRVFFEEWNEPLISGIQWVEELVEIAGGDVLFPELRHCRKAQERVVSWDSVVDRNPDMIFASWCGKKVNQEEIRSRPRANLIAAVRSGQI